MRSITAASLFVLCPIAGLIPASAVNAQSCRLVADLNPGSGPSSPREMVCCFGDTVFFSASDGRVGSEPFVTVAGAAPRLLKDVNPRSGSLPTSFTQAGSKVFFIADDGTHGRELWVSDGTTAGTRLVRDIRPGNQTSDIRQLTSFGGQVVFRADDGTHGAEPWISDGTAQGTRLLKNIQPGMRGSEPGDFASNERVVLFRAKDPVVGAELWSTSGTEASTVVLKDISPGAPGSSPAFMHDHHGAIFFRARGAFGIELYVSDGTQRGTTLAAEINPSGDSLPRDFVSCGDKLYFVASSGGATGNELWVRDSSGTKLVRDIHTGGRSSSPSSLTCVGDKLFFAATDGQGFELWTTSGGASTTRLVRRLRTGGSNPTEFCAVGRFLYFQATDSKATALYVSDGTAAGTTRACANVTFPRSLVLCRGRLLLSAYTAATSHEMWSIDAPGASATRFGDGCWPSRPFLDATPAVLGQDAILKGTRTPSSFVGVLLMDAQPRHALPLPSGCSAYVQPNFLLATLAPRDFTVRLPIPNDSRLDGVTVALQTWWLSPTVAPIQTSNGVVLGVGK